MTPELPLQHLTSPLFKTDDEYQAFRERFVEEMKNHLEQKRNSPTKTPRTDASQQAFNDRSGWGFQDIIEAYDFARTLELELSARDEEIKRLREALTGLLSDWQDQFGENACDCRPEPQNAGHVCNVCLSKAALNPNSGVKQQFPGGRWS